jgi:hypothetical protein
MVGTGGAGGITGALPPVAGRLLRAFASAPRGPSGRVDGTFAENGGGRRAENAELPVATVSPAGSAFGGVESV